MLLAAGFAAVLCHRLKQPKMVGYVLAGLLLGPHTPPFSFIQDAAVIRTLADLGLIFLMVSLGLEVLWLSFAAVPRGAPHFHGSASVFRLAPVSGGDTRESPIRLL